MAWNAIRYKIMIYRVINKKGLLSKKGLDKQNNKN